MYKLEAIQTSHCKLIENRIIDFLNYYKIPKENIVNIRIFNNHYALIIFETDGSKFEETEYRRFDI